MPKARAIRSIATAEYGVARPAGVTYVPDAGTLLVAGEVLLELTPADDLVATHSLPARFDAATLAFDPAFGRLTSVTDGQLLTGRPQGLSDVRTLDLRRLQLGDPAGTTFDPESGDWFILDLRGPSLVRVRSQRDLSTAPVSRIPMRPLGSGGLRGLAYNPADGLLYTAGQGGDGDLLYAIDDSGTVRGTYDLSETGIRDLRAMVFAPSADPTDDPSTVHLYVADAGGSATYGSVTEVTLEAAVTAAAATDVATLVQRIDTSQFTPASPDPSGVVYLPAERRLAITDSEVDETTGAGYHGVNLWQVTSTGSVQDTGTTVPFSIEPTGLGYDPASRTLFISDDDKNRVFLDRPGPDGRFGTSDDDVSWIDVGAYSTDAEDPEFDPATGHLFFIDGVAREIFEIDPVNGVFGDSDDQVSSFDLARYGANDLEGLGSDPARNTLLAGERSAKLIYELTKDGALVRTIDASGISGMGHISGLAMAPASYDASRMSYWIVDRGTDNGSNPNENDGQLFEISASTSVNAPPAVDAGSDQTVVQPDRATLAGVVSDDGLPDPPGTTTSQWSLVSGPGGVTFADPTSPTTTASFSTDGTYVLRLTADDSAARSSDDTTITVLPEGTVRPTITEAGVAQSSDDAEERPSGSVSLTSSDLELVVDGSNQQTVGIRFAGTQIPAGATIQDAYVQFTVDEVSTGADTLTIRGQAADDPGTFTTATGNISSRPRTAAAVSWSPPPWDTVGQAGTGQRTPDLAAVLQEIVDRPGWASGNALALIVTGTGTRTAEAFDGTAIPILHVEYTTGSASNTAPVVNSVGITPSSPATNDTLSAIVDASDADGDPLSLSYRWAVNGSDLAGQTSSTLDLSVPGNGDAGDQISVTVVASDGIADSAPVSSAPVTVVDSPPAPPGAPTGLTATLSTAAVELSWDPNPEPDLAGYEVYRSGSATGPYTKLNGSLLTTPAYADPAAPVGATSYYQVVAVDAAGNPSAPASTSATRTIAVVGASTASANHGDALAIATPQGTAPGDLMLASITVAGSPAVTAPTGWTRVQAATAGGGQLESVLYAKVAAPGEPASATFALSARHSVVGQIVAYRGVDPTAPIDASAAVANPTSQAIVAPSVSATGPGEVLVSTFAIDANTTIQPPDGMLEQAEVAAAGRGKVAAETADQVLGSSGDTGTRTATASSSALSIGISVTLRPA
ncbi:MAG TPA: hypothetical protein VE646_02995 [Actinomycetota bacterium]|nr:hypothetical protein [Actinomycetota bacterium]